MTVQEELKSDFIITLLEAESFGSFEVLVALTKLHGEMEREEISEVFNLLGY